MTIYDISLSISPDLPVWPGDPLIQLNQISKMDEGATCNVSHLSIGVHAGTHVDAPHHFLNNHLTVESLPLEILVGNCFVINIADEVDTISDDVLINSHIPPGVERLIIKTRNSKIWEKNSKVFHKDFVAINEKGAEYLVQIGIKLVGVDYLSVAPFGKGELTHRVLLGAGVIALEGLDLHEVDAGYYYLYCLPLKLMHSDGAPARTILVG